MIYNIFIEYGNVWLEDTESSMNKPEELLEILPAAAAAALHLKVMNGQF